MNAIKIVIADDMEPILLYLEKVISEVEQFNLVGKAKNGKELIDIVKTQKPDLVITDIEMPEVNGIQAIEEIKKLKIKTKFILITGNSAYILTDKELKMGILSCIKKPILDDKKFIEKVKQVAYKKEAKAEKEKQENKKQIAIEGNSTNSKKENIILQIINKIFKSK